MCDILNRQDEYTAFLRSLTSMWGQSFAHPVFSLNPCVRGFIFDVVSKNLWIYTSVQTGANIYFIASVWMWGCPGRELRSRVLYAEAAQLRLDDAVKRGLPSCKQLPSGGTQASAWLPVPICADVSNVNTNPAHFHTFVTASPASAEASGSPPPSWGCWESLDLWQQTAPWPRTGVPEVGQRLRRSIKQRGEPGWEEIRSHQPMSSSEFIGRCHREQGGRLMEREGSFKETPRRS